MYPLPGEAMLSTEAWKMLEERAPALFLAGGTLVVVFATMLGYEAFTGRTAPEDIFGPAGFALGFVGLLGLVPSLVDGDALLVRAGAVVAGLAAVGATATSLANVAELAAVQPPGALRPLSLGIFLGMLLGYPLFAAASLRSQAHPRHLGLLLLVPPAVFALMMSGLLKAAVGSGMANLVLSSGQAVGHLAVGFVLQAGALPDEGIEASAEPAA